MTWEEKLDAFQALTRTNVHMRCPGDWYVDCHAEVKERPAASVLIGTYGNGTSPQAAVEDHWKLLVDELPTGAYLVVSVSSYGNRRAVRWNGYMWADVVETS